MGNDSGGAPHYFAELFRLQLPPFRGEELRDIHFLNKINYVGWLTLVSCKQGQDQKQLSQRSQMKSEGGLI